ncbi:MAG: hypothetical protein RI977_1454 [Bacteroidota bacterium]
MLEGVFIVVDVVVVVVGVSEEIVFRSKYKARSQVLQGQEYIMGFLHLKHFFGIVGYVFALLVAKVGVHVFIAHNLDGVFYANTAVVPTAASV